ncbi:hypothetical protein NBRC116587_30860 [Pseudoteredinibacter isoporae]
MIAACSSIPLGTLWQYRNHDIDDLMALTPESIRAKVQSSEQLIVSKTSLSFTVESDTDKNDYQFPLEIVEQKQLQTENWLGQARREEYSVWKISQSGIDDFKRLQKDWQAAHTNRYQANKHAAQETTLQLGFGVSSQFAEHSRFKDGYFSIWLKLADDKDYQLFIDEHSTNDIHQQVRRQQKQSTQD